MQSVQLTEEAVQAYLKLMSLNMTSWKPQVAEWLHSEDAEADLKQLLEAVPCSPTLH